MSPLPEGEPRLTVMSPSLRKATNCLLHDNIDKDRSGRLTLADITVSLYVIMYGLQMSLDCRENTAVAAWNYVLTMAVRHLIGGFWLARLAAHGRRMKGLGFSRAAASKRAARLMPSQPTLVWLGIASIRRDRELIRGAC